MASQRVHTDTPAHSAQTHAITHSSRLRDFTVESLRRQVGVVPQEPFLFAGSVRDNIAFGRPDSTDEEVLEAAEAVGLSELVEQLPDGIHSYVHERGATLSAGERQLLALARTFRYEPRVVVLDEATSNLDLESETRVEHALDRLLEGRTTIIIAHRLSTAMRADRIAVVDEGRIVELGSHDELVDLGGHYAAMYATWLSHTQPTLHAA
jgi:ATP-binding cassette subfamily B protein